MTPSSYGLVVGPYPVFQPGYGDGIYAEIVPATPLRLRGGRTWREPHIRWWFEIMSDQSPGEESEPLDRMGTHFYKYDGGATTLAGAVRKAIDAIHECAQQLNAAPSGDRRASPRRRRRFKRRTGGNK